MLLQQCLLEKNITKSSVHMSKWLGNTSSEKKALQVVVDHKCEHELGKLFKKEKTNLKLPAWDMQTGIYLRRHMK